jgi:hypothetical protein
VPSDRSTGSNQVFGSSNVFPALGCVFFDFSSPLDVSAVTLQSLHHNFQFSEAIRPYASGIQSYSMLQNLSLCLAPVALPRDFLCLINSTNCWNCTKVWSLETCEMLVPETLEVYRLWRDDLSVMRDSIASTNHHAVSCCSSVIGIASLHIWLHFMLETVPSFCQSRGASKQSSFCLSQRHWRPEQSIHPSVGFAGRD